MFPRNLMNSIRFLSLASNPALAVTTAVESSVIQMASVLAIRPDTFDYRTVW
jgi:hypothetical protein